MVGEPAAAILVELLGEVGDEFKPVDPEPETIAEGQWRMPGSLTIADAAALLGAELESELESESATVGGLVTEVLGRLPAPGDVVEFAGFEWRVERLTGRAVASVRVARLPASAGEGGL